MSDGSEFLWGVGAVAEHIGIATPTLRTWERRYGIGPSRRTEGGHRRYSEIDIRRVQLMNRMVSSGVSAESAAKVALSLDAGGLAAALASDDVLSTSPDDMIATPVESVERIVVAAAAMDVVGVTSVLATTLHEWGALGAWTNVLSPALDHVTERVEKGELGIEVASVLRERVEAELRSVARAFAPRFVGTHPVVLAALDGRAESLAVLALEAALAGKGIAAVSLGFGVPCEALVGLLRQITPTAVYLWSTSEDGARDTVLAAMKAGTPTTILLGGGGWSTIAADVAEIARDGVEVEVASDLPAAADLLVGRVQAAPTTR